MSSTNDFSNAADECPVCVEELGQVVAKLPCGHAFHVKCIFPWVFGEEKKSCPMCRREIGSAIKVKSLATDTWQEVAMPSQEVLVEEEVEVFASSSGPQSSGPRQSYRDAVAERERFLGMF
jgi:hypothetical protein